MTGLTHLAARYRQQYRYTSYGYYPYWVADTGPAYTSSITSTFAQSRDKSTLHFACGRTALSSGATTSDQLAMRPWAPTCPECAVLWDKAVENGSFE